MVSGKVYLVEESCIVFSMILLFKKVLLRESTRIIVEHSVFLLADISLCLLYPKRQ